MIHPLNSEIMNSRIAAHGCVTHQFIQPIKLGQKFSMSGHLFQYLDMEDDYSVFIYLGPLNESIQLGKPCPSCFTMFWGAKEIERNSEEACYGWTVHHNCDYVLYHEDVHRPLLRLMGRR
jgi:hypothetical protein